MAVCTTAQWASYAPQARLTVWQSGETGNKATLSWTLEYIATEPASTSGGRSYTVIIAGKTEASGTYDINGKMGIIQIASDTVEVDKSTAARSIAFSVSFGFDLTWSGVYKGTATASGSLSIAAKTTYTVSYDANGGKNPPASQTKQHGTSLLLSSAKPSRDGYTFKNWLSTAQNQTYNPGNYYGHDASTTMKAQWTANTFTVSYDANGGSGAPGSQTKTYGTALTLSSTKPTRTNYNFLGWATTKTATAATYAAGGSYTQNASVTLYAVWQLAYTKPRITNFKASRCDSSGKATDSGTYALVKFNWATSNTVSGITAAWSSASGGSGSASISASGTSGSISQVIGGDGLGADSNYSIIITVSDSGGSSSATATLNGIAFALDLLAGGKGVAFGKPAENAERAEFGWDLYDRFNTRINNGLAQYAGGNIDPNTTQEELILTKTNTPTSEFWYVKTFFYASKGGNRAQLALLYKGGSDLQHRFYIDGTWSDWVSFSNSAQHPHPYNVVCGSMKMRQAGYIEFYADIDAATAGTSRKGFAGYDTSTGTTFYVKNQSTGAVRLENNDGGVAVVSAMLRPLTNDAIYCGASSYKWKAVYAVNGTIQTSDRNQKKNIQELDQRYIDLFNKLLPVSFEFNDAESDRVHVGFISQDVKAAMDEVGLSDLDFAGYCRDVLTEWDEETQTDREVLDENGDPVYRYSLRYSEFIALNSRMIQLNQEKIAAQRQEIDTLKAEVAELKSLVSAFINK